MQLKAALNKFVITLVILQFLIIAISNYLVQFPVSFSFPKIATIDTTFAAFTFPLIFILTDLTVRLLGAKFARKIIFLALLPALIFSYSISVIFVDGSYIGMGRLLDFNLFYFRIAFASLSAYFLGQLLDIAVFNQLRNSKYWWLPSAFSTILGSALDTFVFFSFAFYRSRDYFMAENWLEFGLIDFVTKIIIAMLLFLPIYGLLLNYLRSRYFV